MNCMYTGVYLESAYHGVGKMSLFWKAAKVMDDTTLSRMS
jgi:hypothetical protein